MTEGIKPNGQRAIIALDEQSRQKITAPEIDKELYWFAKPITVPSGEIWFVSGGLEMAAKNEKIDGKLRVDGLNTVDEWIEITGILVINGTLEVGDRW